MRAFIGVSAALALGSWWALVPALPNSFLVLRRLVVEERYRQVNLDGYASYMSRVEYRMMPGIW